MNNEDMNHEPMDQDPEDPQLPTNPRDMRNLCTRYTAAAGEAHIYLLRYQTPAFIMSVIDELTVPVYEFLIKKFFGNVGQELIRLGYFRLIYDGRRNMTVFLFDTNTIQNTMKEMVGLGVPTLTSDQFHVAIHRILGQLPALGQQKNQFARLVDALIYKAFLELFIQSNLRLDVAFSFTISLDIYANRVSGRALAFHKDATPNFPTRFFTLTYVIPSNANAILKGPTIVTDEDLAARTAVTPAVRHGTTVGIDNTAVLHATPNTTVMMAMPGNTEGHMLTPVPNNNFNLIHRRNDADYQGTMTPDSDTRKAEASEIETDTRDTQRSFIRTWYNIGGFPSDPGATDVHIPLTPDYQEVVDLVQEIRNNTCFIETGTIISPDAVLRDQRMQRISLGGRAETVGNYAQKTPLLEYKPLIGKEPQNASEQKSKPSIGDVLASPEFQKLAASTNNFILGAVVKDKDSVLPMGGKQSSWSKKGKKRAVHTSKRGKRSRTTRRMGGRKKKTYRKSKHTKKRR
jgi:hypothetical protein